MPTPECRKIVWHNADGLRWCARCKVYMDVEQFNRNRGARTPDGLDRWCRLCGSAIRRADYARHREREIARTRAWQEAHPDATRQHRRRAQRVYYRLRKLAREAQRLCEMERAG